MKKILLITAILITSIGFFNIGIEGVGAATNGANAAGQSKESKPILTPPLGNGTAGGSDLKTIFLNVLDIAQTIMIMVTTLYLIYAGFMFVIAKGDPGKLKTARDALLWGLVGAALILCAEVIAFGIGDTVKEVFKGK